jgi:DNA-binding transcriptional LysR family regulator
MTFLFGMSVSKRPSVPEDGSGDGFAQGANSGHHLLTMRNNPSLDLEALATFIEVVARGSFSAGARARGIPRPTATRHVASLEQELGVRLIERTTRAMQVTDAGADLQERARRILDEVRAARDAAAERRNELSGLIRISAPVEYGMSFLAPILSAFATAHPEVRLAVELAGRRVDLVDERVDVAVRIGRLRDSSHGVLRLGAVPFWLCASPKLLDGEPPLRKPEDLVGRRHLVFGSANRQRVWTFQSGGRTVDVPVGPGVVEANNHALLLAAAVDGLGFVRSPTFFAAPAIEAGRLRRALPRWRCPALPVNAVFRRGMETKRIRALLDHMADSIERSNDAG